MPGTAERWRLALFCASAVALVLAAVLLSGGEGDPSASTSALPATTSAEPQSGPGRSSAGLRRDARRFLSAFFRYEVGDLNPKIAQALRRTATAEFAATLLRRAPRAVAGTPPARIDRLSLALLRTQPPGALLSGAASRGSAAEQFSFLFALRRGVWLASGPGQ